MREKEVKGKKMEARRRVLEEERWRARETAALPPSNGPTLIMVGPGVTLYITSS